MLQASSAGLAGGVIYATACSGSDLLVGTDKGLEWISLTDRSTGIFSTPLSFGGGVNSIVTLSGGTAVAGTVGDGSAPAVLLCDVSSHTCSTAGMGIAPAALRLTVFQQAGVPGNPLLAAFAGSGGGGYYLSTDSGAHWNVVSSLPTYTNYVPSFAVSGTTTFAATDHGLMKSTDGGATWAAVNVSGSASDVFVSVAASGNEVYAFSPSGILFKGVYRSADGGATWKQSSNQLGLTGNVWVYGLAVTPNAAWAATNQGVMRSADKGATWQTYNAGLSNLNIAKIVAAGGGSSDVYAMTTSPLVYPGITLVGGTGESNAVFRSSDSGLTWQSGPSITAHGLTVVFAGSRLTDVAAFASGSSVVAVGSLGAAYSTDAGQTWSGAFSQIQSLATSGGTAFGVNVLYCGTGCVKGTLYSSTDGGATWKAVGGTFSVPSSTVSSGPLAVSGSTFAVAIGSTVVRSTDGGSTWTTGPSLPGGSPPSIARLVFAGNALWAADGNGGLWKSGDVGASWTASGSGIPSTASVNDVLQNGADLFAAASTGVYASSDGGNTWATLRGDLAGVNATALAVSGPNLVVGTAGRGILTVALATSVRRLVPIVLDVNGLAHYTTELSLANRGAADASVTMLYTASLGSGTGTVNDTVRAASQTHIPDVIAYLRQKGLAIPNDGSEAGTLLITFSNVSDPAVVGAVARTTAATGPPQPVGSAGLAYMGVDPAGGATGSLAVYGLRSSATDRSNLAVYNMSSDSVTYSVTLFSGDGSGASAVVAAADSLPAWGWRQYNRVLDGPGYANGWAVVTRTSATGALGAYGVVNDNVTSDGSFVEAAPGGARLLYLNVPVLVETSAFLSELILTNASSTPGTFALTYTEGLSPASGAGGSTSVVIPPHTQRIVPNAIAYLRSLGIAVGSPGGNYAGALNIEVTGVTPGEIYAGARTASQSPAGGQFGLFTPAVFPGDEGVTVAYLYGLRSDANNRSNVAAVNAATDAKAGPITLLLEVFDGDAEGTLKGSTTLTLAPGQWTQVSGLLGSEGVSNGWVRVTRTAGTAPWIAYGVVNDGGQPGERTGDGAFVPMSVP